MQNHFLFDSDDPKQRGFGCDALVHKDKRLKFKWMWTKDCCNSGGPSFKTKVGQKRSPGQCSEANLKNGWSLEATFWHCDYEAEVNHYDSAVVSYHIRYDEETKTESPLLTRIDAQLKAEQLFEEMGIDILEQIDQVSSNPIPLPYTGYVQSIKRLQGKNKK